MVYSGRTSWQVSTALEALGANHQLPSKRLSFPHFYLHSQAPFALCIILKVENTFRSNLALFSTEANFPGFSFSPSDPSVRNFWYKHFLHAFCWCKCICLCVSFMYVCLWLCVWITSTHPLAHVSPSMSQPALSTSPVKVGSTIQVCIMVAQKSNTK